MTTNRGRGLSSQIVASLPLATVLLLGLVALASRGPLRATGAGASGAAASNRVPASPWELVLIGVGATVAFAGVALYAGSRRRRTPEPFPTQPRFTTSALLWLMGMLVPLLAGAVLVAGGLSGSDTGSTVTRASRSFAPVHGRKPVGGTPQFDVPVWVPAALGTLALAGALALVGHRLPRRRDDSTRGHGAPRVVTAAVAVSLSQLETDPDPRRAVIEAYRRMERSLAAAGLPRDPAEAPREYLERVSTTLEIDRGPLATLTDLFERARFSRRSIDLSLRKRAIAELGSLQEALA